MFHFVPPEWSSVKQLGGQLRVATKQNFYLQRFQKFFIELYLSNNSF